METFATMVRRDDSEVLLTDSKPAPNPTKFDPSLPTQATWTTMISGLPTAITPPLTKSSDTESDDTNTGTKKHGSSITLILLLSLSAAVMIWILSYVLISRRRRKRGDGKARPSLPRLRWPSSLSLSALLRKGNSYRKVKRSDSSSSLLPTDRLVAGAKLDHPEIPPPPPPGNIQDVRDMGQAAINPSPVELDGQGIGDPPIFRPPWMSRMSNLFLTTGRTNQYHRRMPSSLKARRSIRESFGEKPNDPGCMAAVAVLIQEPKKTFSPLRCSTTRVTSSVYSSEKALPEIPESLSLKSREGETVPIVLRSPRRYWASHRNTLGSLKGSIGWASVRSLPDAWRIEEEGGPGRFTEVRTVGSR
ncbi:hypothetical protein B0T20DRAFT_173390 [Sordaria brevicollis]|uniref:Uncharacterized protein n=1 Tax=Sordaria brevicollis TaxID=83679 RepID=A0AAE0UDZ6_SORBR|nr:hypothetical protein B0T20DRAFT_173390 [Sordaria brevicollis]